MKNNFPMQIETFDRGKMDRRQLMQALGIAATGALAASVAPKNAAFAASAAQMGSAIGTGFKAVAYNHINYQVADYAKVRDFYVNLFGMKPVWDDGKQCSVEFGDPPNAIYIRPLTRPLDRPAGAGPNANWTAQMGQGNVDHLAFSIENFQLDPVKAELQGPERPDGANLRDTRRIPRSGQPDRQRIGRRKKSRCDSQTRRQRLQSVRRQSPGLDGSRCR